jgi:uncharacterized DUF497 family protein
VRIEFDPDKDAINQKKHGFSLVAAEEMDWSTATIRQDKRQDYGESRWQVYGLLDGIPCMAVFTPRG